MKSLKDLEEQANELIEFGNSKEKAEGHGMMRVLEALDGFKNPDLVPSEVNKLIDDFSGDYDDCRELLLAVREHGWTFEYGLDAIPYHLRKMSVIYIKKSNFLHWYFKEGSDDECKDEEQRMGKLLIENMINTGQFSLCAEQVLAAVNYELIPTRICEGIQLYEFLDYNHKIVLR